MSNSEQVIKQTEKEINTKNKKIVKGDSIVELAVNLALTKKIYLFRDEKKEGYAKFFQSGCYEIRKIQGRAFKDYLASLVWNEIKKPLCSAAMTDTLNTLEAIARSKNTEHELHLRTAWHKKSLWYDLGDWRAVRINSKGWKIVKNPPVLFKKLGHQRPQTEPVKAGNIRDILRFVNISQADQILLLTYLVVALIPDIPRVILVIFGDPGSAKTTFFELLKSIIDPSQMETLPLIKNQRELMQLFAHHFALFFDNLSYFPDRISDEISMACTGSSFSKRKLFTDDDDFVYKFKRLIGVNGINFLASKSDILDRSLIFELHRITNKNMLEKRELMQEFEKAKPRILGGIFDVLTEVMRIRKQGGIKLTEMPRMADYATWSAEVAEAMGEGSQKFTQAFKKNIEKQNAEALEASCIAQAVMKFMGEKEIWEGTGHQFLQELQKLDSDSVLLWSQDRNWPRTASWVWKRIKEVRVNLDRADIEASYNDKVRPRLIKLLNRKFKTTDSAGSADMLSNIKSTF
ncbi:hypothetical protein CL633_01285 [bacterium]|nr:hypothetical protein [bacterium]